MTETVADLGRYRERRTIRRVAAVGLVAAVVLGSILRVRETWETVEAAIKWAAEQLPDERGDHAENA